MTDRERHCLAQLKPYTPYPSQPDDERGVGGIHDLYSEERLRYLRLHKPHALTENEMRSKEIVAHPVPQRVIMPPEGSRARLMKIMEAAALVVGVGVRDLTSKRRDRCVVMGRRLYYFFAREITGLSYEVIGEKVSTDHSTVLHGITRLREEHQRYANLINAMEAIFKDVMDARRKYISAASALGDNHEVC